MSFLEDFKSSVYKGLSSVDKSIPCRFFYDEEGSRLFSLITEQEDYYPTRCEKEILRNKGGEIAAALPEGLSVVELGSGTSEKTPLLLAALEEPSSYVPVDIDDITLEGASEMISERFGDLTVRPVHADFTRHFDLPAGVEDPVLGFFPGSTIGNFTRKEAVKFLTRLRGSLGDGAYLLLGADLVKDKAVLEQAYDDRAGVTARFNLNVLVRINRELGGDFDASAFSHRAIWNPEAGAVQMFLESQRDQTVTIGERRFDFEAGERIHTEDSHKYRLDELKELGEECGWNWQKMWTDAKGLYSVHLFRS